MKEKLWEYNGGCISKCRRFVRDTNRGGARRVRCLHRPLSARAMRQIEMHPTMDAFQFAAANK